MSKRQCKYLINQKKNLYHIGWQNGVGSAWNYDGRGAKKMAKDVGPYSISNVSGDFPTALIRETQTADSGVYTLETYTDINSGFDGFVTSLYDANETDIMRIFTKNGCFYALDENYDEKLLCDCGAKNQRYYFTIILDFNTKDVTYFINSQNCGSTKMLTDSFKYYKIGTLAGNILDVVPGDLDLYADYITNSSFISTSQNQFPYDWEKQGNAFVNDTDELKVFANDTEKSTVTKRFSSSSGKMIFEAYIYSPQNKGGFGVEFLSGNKIACGINVTDGRFYSQNKDLRHWLYNLWYILRVTVDTDNKTALIQLNAKEPYTVKFDADFINGVKFITENGAEILLDDVKLWYDIEYADYCPKPVPAKGYGKYNVGINMCSLWHTGDHVGWDCITPFPETKPLMGYYDEGLPEVADWEIKFMVENGITTQFYCWYTDGYQRTNPLKRTRLNNALVDGFMHAKYSDMMSFGLLWEAMGGRPAGSEYFRKNFVPYWIENFFSDKRYVRINNKALMGVFGPGQLISEFGGAEKLKIEFDYLRSEVKKLGYDDLIIFCSATPSEELKRAGFDACYAYGWGRLGYDLDYSKSRLDAMKSLDNIMHFIPTASVGFNRISWGSPRVPCMKVSDFKKLNLYMRDELLPQFKDLPDWTHNFVMLSNWNEFGEGTYINPSGLNGFGYVNAIRDVYTDGKSDGAKDVKPTKTQLKRLSYLYPQDRKIIRPLQRKEKTAFTIDFNPDSVVKHLDISKNKWTVGEADVIKTKDGFTMYSTGNDAKMTYNEKLNLSCTKATHVRIVMKSSCAADGCIYFTTSTHNKWCGQNAADFQILPGTHEYLVKLDGARQNNFEYKGKLLEFRIDPNTSAYVKSEVISVEFFSLDVSETKKQFFINGENIILDNDIIKDGSHTLVPFFQDRMIYHRLNAFYKWDGNNKVLSLYANNASVVFYMDTNKAVINGETRYLDCTPIMEDGVPMFPIDIVCDVFRYKLTEKNGSIYVKTPFDK